MSEQVLLFSGGIDSYIAWHYLDKPKTVYFNLGTPYSDYEIRVVKELIPSTIIDNSTNLASRQESVNAFIPMRNLYFAMLACKYGDEIVICGLKDDNVNDKTPEMFRKFSELLSELNGRRIKVSSPFWKYTKAEIVQWYMNEHNGHDLICTISCYTPEKDSGIGIKRYCGRCPCCFRKWNALYVNGIKLAFHNYELMSEYFEKAKKGFYCHKRNISILEAVTEYRKETSKHFGKKYRVDIDGILTNETEGHDYRTRTPNIEWINKINQLAVKGARIILWTSRYEEDRSVTVNWLNRNGVHFHELSMDKPKFDGMIDDKMININDL